MTQLPTWTPREGDIVHFRDDKNPELAGRYRLDLKDDEPGYFAFTRLRSGKAHMLIWPSVLIDWHEKGAITPIDPAELERDRQLLELRSAAPLRARRPVSQSDVDGLALFDAHRAPTLL